MSGILLMLGFGLIIEVSLALIIAVRPRRDVV
jgi:hypothetical protein